MPLILNIFLMVVAAISTVLVVFYLIETNKKLKIKIQSLEQEKEREKQKAQEALQSRMDFQASTVTQNIGKKVIGITGDGVMCIATFKGLEYFDKPCLDQNGIPVLEDENGVESIHFGKVFLHTFQLEKIFSKMPIYDRKAVIWSTYPVGHHMSGIEYKE